MQVKNTLLLDALKCKETPRPPVWMMRQAGRYLPQYQAIRSTMSFLDLCKNSQKAAEVSIQPYEILGVDGIIMFSDILVPLEPMGACVSFDSGKPEFKSPIRSQQDIEKLIELDVPSLETKCSYVFETIEEIARRTHNEVPILGFAGAPWTLASYMIEGGGSKDFALIKRFTYQHPEAMMMLLDKLSFTIANHLIAKIKHGVHAVQLFDTWASSLSQEDYRLFALPYQQKIISQIRAVYPDISITLYINGCANVLDMMMESGANCLSIDWRMNLNDTRNYVLAAHGMAGFPKLAIQGNLDPCTLLAPKSFVIDATKYMLEMATNDPGYIANLGHGILPEVPVENALAFIQTVQAHKC